MLFLVQNGPFWHKSNGFGNANLVPNVDSTDRFECCHDLGDQHDTSSLIVLLAHMDRASGKRKETATMVETRSNKDVKKTKKGKQQEKKKTVSTPMIVTPARKGKTSSEEGSTKKRKAATPEGGPPRIRAKVEPPEPPPEPCWSDRSNVGNLSIREKWVLAVAILGSICFSWSVCFSLSVCGKSPPLTPDYKQDLTVCKATWSATGWLTDGGSSHEELVALRLEAQTLSERLERSDKTNIMLEKSVHQVNSTLNRQIEVLKISLEAEKEQVHAVKTKLSEHEVQMGKMDQENKKYESTVQDLQKKLTGTKDGDTRLQQLEAEKQQLSKDLAAVSKERDDKQQQLQELLENRKGEEKGNKKGERSSASGQVSSAEYEAMKTTLNDLKTKNENLQGLQNEKIMLSKDLATATRDRDNSKQGLEKLRQQFEKEQTATKQLTEQLDVLKGSFNELQKTNAADQDALKKAMKKLTSERDAIKASQAKNARTDADDTAKTSGGFAEEEEQPTKKRPGFIRRIFNRKGSNASAN